MAETIVPTMFFLIVVGAPVAAWIVSRVLAHQERMEMIRHGFAPPPDPKMTMKAGKYGYAPGAMPPPPPGMGAPPRAMNYHAPYPYSYDAQAQLRRGMQVAFIGLALLIGLSFIGIGGGHVLGPWLLGGLIPMFVGVAQIISAVMSGARIGGFTPDHGGSAHFGPVEPEPVHTAGPGPTQTGNMPPPPPSSYGGWRPGSTPEIGKPPSPPEYRG